jgi:hypothetical protein
VAQLVLSAALVVPQVQRVRLPVRRQRLVQVLPLETVATVLLVTRAARPMLVALVPPVKPVPRAVRLLTPQRHSFH